ncbi:PKD domain-containing protein [Marinoscillum furvescens]|uniref:PKD domain-containing protein n=1 Tax=Marinoscillum furvescens DSM 4134 TaxID=1122208 RepID=A0A3D9L2L4_MARFU|nr:PKD domain-containing protein [Marinoscillum furvescens]RED98981.1 PKD domain-containing protein [Marinoscillum furvescens DSM 4134]
MTKIHLTVLTGFLAVSIFSYAQEGCGAQDFYERGAAACTDYIEPVKCINLDITESFDFDGLEMDFSWDMGDGTQKKGLEVEHCYEKAGKYNAALTVTDLVTKVVMENELEVDVYIRGEFALAMEPVEVKVQEPFTPTYELKHPKNYELEAYYWSFGDGRFSCEKNPEITYSTAAEYALVLNVVLRNDTDIIHLCAQQLLKAEMADPTGGRLEDYFDGLEVPSRFLATPVAYRIVQQQGDSYQTVAQEGIAGGESYALLVYRGSQMFLSDEFTIPEGADATTQRELMTAAAAGVLEQQPIEFRSLYFELNTSGLTKKMKKALNKNADLMKAYPFLSFVVGSYTHTGGDYERNVRLSRSRSQLVREYLISEGVAAAQLSVADPAVQRALINTCVTRGCDYEDESLNRRTDFKVTGLQ